HLTYQINNVGTVKVIESMVTTPGAKVSNLFRFGMQMQMPLAMDQITYYGRGPIENYQDRKTSTFVDVYKQTVAEQFYPYIRPQENGTKSDIRWWNQLYRSGCGLQFIAEQPFSASALNYSIESLDEGLTKGQRHSALVPTVDYTNFCIDLVQRGLACRNSWGCIPLEPYRITYKDMTFTFIMKPVQFQF
ncbi:MAG: beta-galactosidase small subunit, partial [Bacteroidaceae bacterium]|nr:beta-galactosidase small subunit [Bacteroidaceae bacterium]